MVVVLLAGLWALILLPNALRGYRFGSPLQSIDAFEQSMSRLDPSRHIPGGHVMVLERPDRAGATPYAGRPAAPAVASPRAVSRPRQAVRRGPSPRTLQRRRQVLLVLVAAVVATTVGGLTVGGWAWGLFLAAYVALFGYLALLAQLRVRRDEAHSKVHHLPVPPARRPSTGVIVHSARGA